jgi:hypothetical protein
MKLLKNVPFEIDPKEPFKNDQLKQKRSIELLTTLLQSTEQPFVISVEAPWGWGKTTFIKRWKAYLETKEQVCLYFNAWENDFVSDPLVAFIGEMKAVVERAKGGTDANSPIRKSLSRLQKFGSTLAKKGAPIVVKALATRVLGSDAMKDVSEIAAESAEEVAEFLSETAKKQIERYEEEKSSIRGFRIALQELAAAVTDGETKPKQLVFFVDELDRCRPDFAMTLLERIKHLFNVEKVVFVLSLDREQLRNTVRFLYGTGDSSDVYLRRFIDLPYALPQPSPEEFAKLLYSRYRLQEIFQADFEVSQAGHDLVEGFAEIASSWPLDLRTQEQCFTRMNVVLRLLLPKLSCPMVSLAALVVLKVASPDEFDAFSSGEKHPRDIFPRLAKVSVENLPLIEATLCLAFLNDSELKAEKESAANKLKEPKAQDAATDETLKSRGDRYYKLISGTYADFSRTVFRKVVRSINLSTSFEQ